MKRSIVIFPEFTNVHVIHDIRTKYDPLAEKVAPHVTLVFPFDSDLTQDEIVGELKNSLADITAFPLQLQGFSIQDEEYVFLNVVEGDIGLINLHIALYKGLLSSYLNTTIKYVPHLTVGRFTNKAKLHQAYEECCKIEQTFSCIVNKISIEEIRGDDTSVIECDIGLADNNQRHAEL